MSTRLFCVFGELSVGMAMRESRVTLWVWGGTDDGSYNAFDGAVRTHGNE